MAELDSQDGGVASASFSPLRADPPPELYATWWLRYLLFLSALVAIGSVLLTEYGSDPGESWKSSVVIAAHALVAALLIWWSALAMLDAGLLVPATRYRKSSRAWLAVLLWVLAFAAPLCAFGVIRWAQGRFADSSDGFGVMAVTTVAVLATFLVVWMPFQYHALQGRRIGTPIRVMQGWFWAPLLAAVGGVTISAMGLHSKLADAGMNASERTVEVAVVYGLPALVFALSTWRATTVFDEVVDLRWRDWKNEWEYTLAEMAVQPAPGPELPRREWP